MALARVGARLHGRGTSFSRGALITLAMLLLSIAVALTMSIVGLLALRLVHCPVGAYECPF